MPAILRMHKISINVGTPLVPVVADAYFLASPKTYVGGLAADCGVSRPTDADPDEFAGKRRTPVSEMLKFNDIQSATIYYVKNGRKNRAIVLCTEAKIDALLAKDGTLNYQGDTKAKVRQPRRATFK